MDKSIEEIWKNCHTGEDLIAPKYDKHYAKKSKLITEKIRKIQNIDNNSAIVFAIISLIGFGFTKWLYLGIYLFVFFMALYIYNSIKLKELYTIDANLSTRNFIVEYKKRIDKLIDIYLRIITFILPIVLISVFWLFLKEFEEFNTIIEDLGYAKTSIFLIIITLVTAVLGHYVYKYFVRLFYNSLLIKLDNVLYDIDQADVPRIIPKGTTTGKIIFIIIVSLVVLFIIGYLSGYMIASVL
ncbi:MAG: hypothetical protein ABFR62_11405 [Bacteroidota bacterium]